MAHRHGVTQSAKLNIGHILQLKGLSRKVAGKDYVAELLCSLKTSGISHNVFERHLALLTERTRSGLDVLLAQGVGYIARHEAVLLHLIRLEPYTHRVSLHTRAHHITDTLDTFQGRHDVDFVVVCDELVIVTSIRRDEGVHDNLRRLAFVNRHTHTGNLGRQL